MPHKLVKCLGEACSLYFQGLCQNIPQALKVIAAISFETMVTIYNGHGMLKKT
jgi:hypothetical protein